MIHNKKVVACILAAGAGIRHGREDNLPKQFQNISGKPLVVWVLDLFQQNEYVDEIFLAVPDDFMVFAQGLAAEQQFTKPLQIVSGRETGQATIKKLLEVASGSAPENAIVVVHDGVRPCVSQAVINECIQLASEEGACVTAVPVSETPVLSTSGVRVESALPRSDVFIVQAPQAFELGALMKLHNEAEGKSYIDSCSLYIATTGYQPLMVLGSRSNIKVTTSSDSAVVAWQLANGIV